MTIKSFKKFITDRKDRKILIFFGNLFFAGIYFLIATASLKLATINSSVSPVWPPTGLSISILLLFGRRYIFGIYLGALLANLVSLPLAISMMVAFGNSAEGYFGAWLYIRFKRYSKKLEHLSEPLSITLLSILAPLLGASIGVGSLYFFGLIPTENLINAWTTWWVGDLIGALFVLPIFVSLADGELTKLFAKIKARTGQTLLVVAASVALLIAIYTLFLNTASLKYLFIFFPVLIAFSLIKNRFYIYFFTLILSTIAIYLTASGNGPFSLSSFNQNILNLEVFLVALGINSLAIASFKEFKFILLIRGLLILGWIFWGVLFYNIQHQHEISDEEKFEKFSHEIENRIQKGFTEYSGILYSGRSLYMASDDVTSTKWRNFVKSMNILDNHNGLRGMGVVFRVPKASLEKHIAKYKAEIGPQFRIKYVDWEYPDAGKPLQKDHFVVSLIEPLAQNESKIGVDLGSESKRRTAAENSINSGKPTMTEQISILGNDSPQPGFQIFLPVYKKNLPTSIPAERQLAFSHWIYMPIITEEFFKGILGVVGPDYIVQIHEITIAGSKQVVYEQMTGAINPNSQGIVKPVQLGNKVYYISLSKSLTYTASHDLLSTWIGFIGSLSILIVVLYIINIQLLEDKTQKLATQLNHDYIQSQLIVKEQESVIADSSKMAALGEMAGSIAHEINNPLAIISGNAQLLELELANPSVLNYSAKALTHTKKILGTIKRIEKIIKGLRLLSRDAAQDPMQSVAVKNLIDDTVSICHERFRHANIQIRVSLEYKGELCCRDTQISQVLLNLLNNSFDAIVGKTYPWVELSVHQKNDFIEISVVDSGTGIPPEIQQKIMHPFFTTKEIGKGTGLGLSISKGIINSHGGKFFIEQNSLNTKFVIQIPIRGATAPSKLAA